MTERFKLNFNLYYGIERQAILACLFLYSVKNIREFLNPIRIPIRLHRQQEKILLPKQERARLRLVYPHRQQEITFDYIDGYSDMKVVLEAMEACGSVDPAKLSEALLSEDGFDEYKGHIQFNPETH